MFFACGQEPMEVNSGASLILKTIQISSDFRKGSIPLGFPVIYHVDRNSLNGIFLSNSIPSEIDDINFTLKFTVFKSIKMYSIFQNDISKTSK